MTSELEIKRSRFRCDLVPVESEDAARDRVEQARKEFWDARHHCSAFILGPDRRIERSNDDGEPAGTAGAPMLEVLRGSELTDVVAVVTRWFGGTLLGAGGLVRAYSDAVREAVAVAPVITRELLGEWAVEVPHADAGRVESVLRQQGFDIVDHSYAAAVTLQVATARADELAAILAAETHGESEPVRVGERWVTR